MGTPQTPISYGYCNSVPPNDILRPPMAAHRYWTPRYEEEHDPWNAHLRSTNSASSSGTVSYTSQTGAQTHSVGVIVSLETRQLPRVSLTCRYSHVDVQNSEQIRLQPHLGTEDTMARSPTEGNFCDCSSTCNYCSSRCCLRKRGHTVHLCLIHKIP